MSVQSKQHLFGGLIDDLVEADSRDGDLGIDGEGWKHHWYADADVVVVFRERKLDDAYHLGSLGKGTLDEWIHHVYERRGWSRLSHNAELAAERDAMRKGVVA